MLWFHGTPGGRRQFPLVGRRAAENLGLRVVMVERAGSGVSDSHAYSQVAVLGGVTPRRQTAVADPEIEAMFIDDILAARGRFLAMVEDARLFGRDWGFRLADVKVPVRWWHGDADQIVTFADAKTAASPLPDAELILMPDESHLGGFASADDILGFIRSHL